MSKKGKCTTVPLHIWALWFSWQFSSNHCSQACCALKHNLAPQVLASSSLSRHVSSAAPHHLSNLGLAAPEGEIGFEFSGSARECAEWRSQGRIQEKGGEDEKGEIRRSDTSKSEAGGQGRKARSDPRGSIPGQPWMALTQRERGTKKAKESNQAEDASSIREELKEEVQKTRRDRSWHSERPKCFSRRRLVVKGTIEGGTVKPEPKLHCA